MLGWPEYPTQVFLSLQDASQHWEKNGEEDPGLKLSSYP